MGKVKHGLALPRPRNSGISAHTDWFKCTFRIRQPDGLKISTAASTSTGNAPTLIRCMRDSSSAEEPPTAGFHPIWWADGPLGQPGLAAPQSGKPQTVQAFVSDARRPGPEGAPNRPQVTNLSHKIVAACEETKQANMHCDVSTGL